MRRPLFYSGLFFLLLLCCSIAMGQRPVDRDPFTQACRLLDAGKEAEAFLTFLTVPGGEHRALQMARPNAGQFVAVLRERGKHIPFPRAKLLEGDLLLATGRQKEALECYRQVAARMGKTAEEGWQKGMMPPDYYPVEPPLQQETGFHGPALPFSLGPGSHRDNWLVRRFISLDAADDAGRELARIWELHREAARPHVVLRPVFEEDKEVRRGRFLIRPMGFDGRALQFAVDYAYFLKRRGENDRALAVLLEPVLRMDMDRDPNRSQEGELIPEGKAAPFPVRAETTRRFSPYSGFSAGLTRKEYLRLVYGYFKALGKTEALLAAVEEQMGKGENRARRVLARLRVLDGRLPEGLALELEYIRNGEFDPPTIAYRRGLVYEEFQKNAEAAAEYERVLALPYSAPRLPDPEEALPNYGQAIALISQYNPLIDGGLETPEAKAFIHSQVLERLQRLYAALGKTDKVLDTTLRQLEVNPALLENLPSLEEAVTRFKAAGGAARFAEWGKARFIDLKSPTARANLRWVLGDVPGTLQAVSEAAQARPHPHSFDHWKERFRRAGKEPLRSLLAALVQANPDDLTSRLELLDLEDRFEGPEIVRTLEALLASDAQSLFVRGKGVYNRTQFRNYFDLAYRLMRLYEKGGEEAKLVALGFRVLEGEAPFKRPEGDAVLPTPRADWNGYSERAYLEDLLACVYLMLPHVKQAPDLARLKALAERSACIPLKNQVGRLVSGEGRKRIDPAERHSRKHAQVSIRTPGLPAGAQLLTNRDDVRALSPDGRWAGTGWGLVRYQPGPGGSLGVLQIPLGARVTSFCQTPAGLFVGTRRGVFRLDDPNGAKPAAVRVHLEALLPSGDRAPLLNVEQMLWWKDSLWLTASDDAYRFDPARGEGQRYDDVGDRLFPAAGRLWGRQAVLDERSGEFEKLQHKSREWGLIGATSQEIWCDVYVNDELRHRPALLDPETLQLRVLSIKNAPAREPLLVNNDFEILAEEGDRVWLLGDGNLTVYDRKSGELRLVRAAEEGDGPVKHQGPAVWRAFGSTFARYHLGSATVERIPGLVLDGDRGPVFCWERLPNGRLLLGSGIVREWAEDNLGFDDNEGMSHHVQDLEGGLFEIDPRTLAWEKIGSPVQELSDFYVKRLFFDDAARRCYVCTNGGVTVLSLPDCVPVGRITVSDGLPSNKVEDVARIGQKLYFACELGDDDGGLAVMDLSTGLIRTLTVTDGLTSNKVRRLRVDGSRLHVLYGTVYNRHGRIPKSGRWIQVGEGENVLTAYSSVLDTVTGKIADGKETLPAPKPPDESKSLPYLGGAVLVDVTHGGKRFIGGTHGLVILDAGASIVTARPDGGVAVRQVLSRRQGWLAGIAGKKVAVRTPAELAAALDANPYHRAEAMASILQQTDRISDYLPLLAGQLNDPEVRVRSTSLYVITRSTDDAAVIPLLRKALDDRDTGVRGLAALELARRGRLPEVRHLREVLEWERAEPDRNYTFGATSTVGVQVDRERLYEAVAPLATPEVFALLLEHPLPATDSDPRPKIFKAFGASLRKHPAAVGILLKARDDEREGSGRVYVVQTVFRHAGRELLPALHAALASNERVVRSNAGRACGAIGDPSSIPHLIRALRFESGLSRASIVWALGELKAREALPELVKLYVDAQQDSKRREGAGYRQAQFLAAVSAQFDHLSSIDAIGSEFNELKAAPLRRPGTRGAGGEPGEGEELLRPGHILEAVRKIGPAVSQEFYRGLAGVEDEEARAEAAVQLAEGKGEDLARNLPILRNMLADGAPQVRMAAAVSLLLLGEEAARAPILEWLGSASAWEQRLIVGQLARVKDRALLAFARQQIDAVPEEIRRGAGL
jgi:HEAT repeat protein/tetratricopeptide (TPR) repeat protein